MKRYRRLQRFSCGYAPMPWWHGHLGRVADHAGKMPAPLLQLMGLRTTLMLACCLALGAIASPAIAKTIVVTTLDDIADPPFDADGPCGAGTIKDLPGADNLVSLREAIIAANNTKGADTITFAPSLSGGTIPCAG